MSYEGYERWLCENGHLSGYDCYDAPEFSEPWACPQCGARCAWRESVDTTNEEGQPTELVVLTYKTVQVPDTYAVPTEQLA